MFNILFNTSNSIQTISAIQLRDVVKGRTLEYIGRMDKSKHWKIKENGYTIGIMKQCKK